MSNIVIYDPNDIVVPYKVTQYLISVNTPDYDPIEYKIVNPDLSGLSGIQQIYWKVNTDTVVEMTEDEKIKINDFIKSKTLRNKNFKIKSFDSHYQITKETWYDTDKGDGTYSGMAEETTFVYSESLASLLLSKTVKTYYEDGTVYESIKTEYFKNANNQMIEKTYKE